MKGLLPLFIGIFGTFAFSWVGLSVIPNLQIGNLGPQSDEEGTDTYPVPKSGMAERGRRIYAANGCIYCHSQQVRPDYAASDIDRKWGDRRTAPRDYLFDRPVLLGKERIGPDLTNIGKRAPAEEENPPGAASAPSATPGAAATSPAPVVASPAPAQSASPAVARSSPTASPTDSSSSAATGEPPPYSAAWHHRHLYSPRSVSPDTRDSNMPAYRFLYEKHLIDGERSADALELTGADAPPVGWEIVPTYDAKCLVAYLMSLDRSHPLNEVKSVAPVASPTASPAAPAAAGKGAK